MSKKNRDKKKINNINRDFNTILLDKRENKYNIIFLLISFIILFGKLFFYPPASADFISQFYPFGTFNKEYFIHHFSLPFWNPFVCGGTPNLDTGFGYNIFYLLFVYLFPIEYGVGIGYALIVLMGGIFAYIFFKSLKIDNRIALISALIYMMSGDMVSYLYPGHIGKPLVMALIPIILFFINRGIEREKYWYFIFAGIGMGFQYFAHPQIFYYSTIMIGIYYLLHIYWDYKDKKDLKRIYKFIGYGVIMGVSFILISLNQFIEQYNYSKLTSRGNVSNPEEMWNFATSWSSHPYELLTFFIPSLFGLYDRTYIGWKPFVQTTDYIGTLTILFAIIGSVIFWKRKDIKFFIFFVILSLLFGLGKFFPQYYKIFYNYFPLIKKFRVPVSIYLVTSFGIVYLAFWGLASFFDSKNVKKIWYLIIGYLFFYLILTIYVNSDSYISLLVNNISMRINTSRVSEFQLQDYVRRNILPMVTTELFRLWIILIIFTASFYLFVKDKRKLKTFFFITTVLIFFDLYMIDKKFVKTVDNYNIVSKKTDVIEFLQSKNKNEKFRIAPLPATIDNEANKWMLYNIESVFGYNAIALKRWDDVLKHRWFSNLKLLGLFNVKYIITKRPINHPDLNLVYKGTKYVYENKYFLPRFMLIDKYKIIKNEKDILSYMASSLFNPAEEVVLEDNIGNINLSKSNSLITLIKWDYDRIVLKADIKKRVILFASEIYYPKWRCYINNKEHKIYRADYLFRAVILPEGSYKIVFQFHNNYFYLISTLFHYFITLLVIIFLIVKIKRKEI